MNTQRKRKLIRSADYEYDTNSDDDIVPPVDAKIYVDKETHFNFLKRKFNIMSGDKEVPRAAGSVSTLHLPKTTSSWPSASDIVYESFKVRKCVFDINTILWPTDKNGINMDNFFGTISGSAPSHDYYDKIFSYLDTILAPIDTDELEWYTSSGLVAEHAEGLFALTFLNKEQYKHDELTEEISKEISIIEARMLPFLCHLRTLLEMNNEGIYEKTYEELFRHFLNIVGLTTFSGEVFSTLTFQYEDSLTKMQSSISSQPDLFVYNVTQTGRGFAVGVVEVKKDMKMHKKIVQHRHQIAETSVGQGPKPGTSASEDEGKGDDIGGDEKGDNGGGDGKKKCPKTKKVVDPCALMKTDYPNGQPRLMTPEEENAVSVFLPQLLGEVAAAVNCPRLNLKEVPLRHDKRGNTALKSIIGFGVVGFKVYVINFVCVRRDFLMRQTWNFHLIPCIAGLGVDVLVSEPQNLLKRQDRNKLFKLFWAMKNF